MVYHMNYGNPVVLTVVNIHPTLYNIGPEIVLNCHHIFKINNCVVTNYLTFIFFNQKINLFFDYSKYLCNDL